MKALKLKSCVAAVCSTILFSAAFPGYAHDGHTNIPEATKTVQTDAALRDLWVGHAFWVRNVVIETLRGNKAGASAAEQEVVANAKAIAGTIEPFYGKAASEKLFGLLAGHYGAVKQYLDAANEGSKAKQDAAMKTLTTNVDEIAAFLSKANPNLPYETLQSLLLAHGSHHVQQIQQIKAKQYAEEAKTWSAMKDHMYVIADALTGALAKQFPDKFQ